MLALGIACGGARHAEPLDVRQRFETTGLPPVDVRLSIQPEHGGALQRYVRAAMATLKNHGEWLGPLPQQSLTIVDPPWHGSPVTIAGRAVVLERTPWWSTTTSMAPELATARAECDKTTRRLASSHVKLRRLREELEIARMPWWRRRRDGAGARPSAG